MQDDRSPPKFLPSSNPKTKQHLELNLTAIAKTINKNAKILRVTPTSSTQDTSVVYNFSSAND